MKTNVIIKDIAVYHPDNKVDNNYFINHFDRQGKDIRRLLEVMGREYRFISVDKNENSLTMGIESAKKVLDQTKLTGKDIDLIVFCSLTPEYISPTNALKIHYAINGKNSAIVYDLNCNCVGMLLALENVSIYMKSNPNINNALIVGAEQFSRFSKATDEFSFSNFADSACAVILEKKVAETYCGFIDSAFYIDSSLHSNIQFPDCGLSKINDSDIKAENRMIGWGHFDTSILIEKTVESIEQLLEQHSMTKSDIKQFFFSQLSKKNIDLIREKLNLPADKFMYIGGEYGYTGGNSLFIALAKGINQKLIKRGDIILLWSLAAGWTISAVLFRY